jgi:hypothetical protein
VLSETEHISGRLYYRSLGKKHYSAVEMKRLASHVFEVHIPEQAIPDDFEYYIQVEAGEEQILLPASAQSVNDVVIIL